MYAHLMHVYARNMLGYKLKQERKTIFYKAQKTRMLLLWVLKNLNHQNLWKINPEKHKSAHIDSVKAV